MQTKENIELGAARLYDTTYKTNFGKAEEPSPIHFERDQITPTDYNYTESIAGGTINSKLILRSQPDCDWFVE